MTDQADSRFAHLPPPPAPPHWWEVPPTSPPLTGAPLPPLPTRRRVEVGVRNLVLGLGVLSLVAAAVSFVAMHWEILDASLRAVVVVGATVPILLGTVEARRRRLSGTATALSWLLMVWMFVGLWAVLRAIDFTWSASASWAVGGAVLFVMFVGLQRVHTDAAMKTGAILAWLTGWLSAFDVWNVHGPDVWVLPIAAVVGWLQWTLNADDPDVDSWGRYGLALLIGAVPATLTALGDPNPMRPMIVIGVSALVVVIGLALRHVAPIHVGGATLGILVGAQLFEVIRAFPGWTIFTLIGLAFLAVGAIFERRLRRAGLIDEKPGDAEGHGIPIAQTGDWPGLP